MIEKVHIGKRVNTFKKKAAKRYNMDIDECHIGHVILEAFLDEPHAYHQIDAITNTKETNLSVAYRTCRLSSAMVNAGLKPDEPVIIMGYNHLDLAIPFYACHFNGHPMCGIDPGVTPSDLLKLFPYIKPRMVFCQNSCVEKVKMAFKSINEPSNIVVFDDKNEDLEAFIRKHKGSEINYRPVDFDQSKIVAWLMLTSGTTGLPKVAMIPFDTLLRGMISWWEPFSDKFEMTMAMATLQWLSSLIFFVSAPLRGYTRIQSSQPITPQSLVGLINKYRPNVTAWTPYLLGQFLVAAENVCDLSCFRYIAIGGSAIEKPLLDRFRKKCGAFLYLVYGMTELLVPVFDFNANTPFGSTGKQLNKFEYRLIDDEGHTLEKPFKTGELWLKGDAFFTGYLNNNEETRLFLTDDGWFKTGDLFYKDDQGYFYFVERMRLMIKYLGNLISPLQMEEVIKRHSGVAETCVVSIPDPDCMELPIAAVVRKNDADFEPQEIFDLLKENLPEGKQLRGGVFFVESLPETPSGKVHRARVKELAFTAQRILSK